MRFESSAPGGTPLGLAAAALRGLSVHGGPYLPVGEVDLRPALYAPTSEFADFAAATAMALFPGELDPFLAERLAAAAFSLPPSAFVYGEDLFLLDFASGPSGSSADYGAAFLAALIAAGPRPARPRLVLAAAEPASAPPHAASQGAALAEALSGSPAGGCLLVLLKPRGAEIRGLKPFRLARSGGRVLVLEVDCPSEAVDALLSGAAGGELAGYPVTIGGADNPAFFAARVILHAAAFSLASRGSAGDLLFSLAPEDGMGLAAALWAWRYGLPQSGLVLPRVSERAPGREPESRQSEATGSEELETAPLRSGRGHVERFGAEHPGALRSLVRGEAVDRAGAEAARKALAAAGGPELDLASAYSLAAAEKALAEGLRGHARIVVGREALPAWESEGRIAGALSEAPADATVAPSLGALDSAIGGLLREFRMDKWLG